MPAFLVFSHAATSRARNPPTAHTRTPPPACPQFGSQLGFHPLLLCSWIRCTGFSSQTFAFVCSKCIRHVLASSLRSRIGTQRSGFVPCRSTMRSSTRSENAQALTVGASDPSTGRGCTYTEDCFFYVVPDCGTRAHHHTSPAPRTIPSRGERNRDREKEREKNHKPAPAEEEEKKAKQPTKPADQKKKNIEEEQRTVH
jgi:hypothetical protein